MENLKAVEEKISINGIPGNADVSPVLTLVFATLCFSFWANSMGFLKDGAVLAIGVLQLGVFVTYTVGGLILISRGNAFGGNTFLIFATIFGGVGGLTHVGMTIAAANNIPFDYTICGIAFIMAGLFLLFMVPGLKYAPKTDFLSFLFGGLGVLGYGLTGAGLAPGSLNIFAAWCLFIDGVVGFYSVIVLMLNFLGLNLSLGKPFFK